MSSKELNLPTLLQIPYTQLLAWELRMSSPAATPHQHHSPFSSILHSLSQTPYRLRRRLLATWTPDQELNQVRERSGADMKKKLEWYDLVALGVGGMLGAGVFVTTGRVANKFSGPAVCISYLIAGISAFLSSLCYTEFSVEIPVAGGAFSYLRVTFGEFVGYFGGANILLEYVLSNAAVARSFTEYLSTAFGLDDPNSWRIAVGGLSKDYNNLDIPAVVLVILLTLCLCHRKARPYRRIKYAGKIQSLMEKECFRTPEPFRQALIKRRF